MFATMLDILKSTVRGYVGDNALSRGAAIAYYTAFSLVPALIIAIAAASFVFGYQAAQGAILAQLGGLVGETSASAIQAMIQSASNQGSGTIASFVGVASLLVTATGVFTEMQSALNAIWRVEPRTATLSHLVRARVASLGLVPALGFLLLVSLILRAAIEACHSYLDTFFPAMRILLEGANFVVSFGLITILLAAIYKVLPDKSIAWRDVAAGAVATAFLFTVGKHLISLYLGSSGVTTSYGATDALLIILIWVYYSAQIFLLGAEFTKVVAERRHRAARSLIARSSPGPGRGNVKS